MWVLVVYKLVAYKKTKWSKSIPGFCISRLSNLENVFNVNIFFICNYVRIINYSFKNICIVCCLKFRFYCLIFPAIWIQLISQHQTITIFRLPRRLEDALEDVKLLRWTRVENVFKTSSRPTNACWNGFELKFFTHERF